MKKFAEKNSKTKDSSKKIKKAVDEIDKSRISYKEASSDDEFATKNFMFSSEDSDSEAEQRKRNLKRKRKQEKSDHSKLKPAPKEEKVIVDLDNDEEAEFDEKTNDKKVDNSDDEVGSDHGADESDSSGDDSSSPSYRIQYILGRKEMTPTEWISVCDKMYTHEITRGSVWQQPDEEYLDPTTQPLEKFLIKWMNMSYLHLSWETEKDLLEMVGSTAKKQIKKYRLREYYGVDLFEDLSKGEYFLPACLQVERILDIDDATVDITSMDWKNAPLPTITLNVPGPAAAVTGSGNISGAITTVEVDISSAPAADAAEMIVDGDAVVPIVVDLNTEVEGSEPVVAADGSNGEEDEASEDSDGTDSSDDDLVEWANTASSDIRVLGGEDDQETELRNTDSENESGDKKNKTTTATENNKKSAKESDDLNGKLVITRNGKTFVKSGKKVKQPKAGKTPKVSKGPKTAKKISSKKPKINEFLHGVENCWVTVKWEGSGYSDVSFEDIRDLVRLGVDYEQPLRGFYAREQLPPKSVNLNNRGNTSTDNSTAGRQNALLQPEVISNTATQPVFLEGAELRDYQWEGVRWLLFNWAQGRNSILADEMGLGKTIQTAAFLQMLKRHGNSSGPFLVVAPLSTLVNWHREISLWTDMDAVIYHGSFEDREMIREYEFKYMNKKASKDKSLSNGYKIEVIITSPETCLIGDTKTSATGRMRRELSKIHWDVVVIDEAHKLKNFDSKISATLREEYSYNNTLLLTGTPLQNNTDELWTLLNFVARDEFSDRELFTEQFGELKTSAQLDLLHSKLKPYLLRREKDLVEKTVPPKVEVIIEIELTVTQKQYYRAIYEQKTDFLYKGGAKDGPNLTNLAMELRKCCNHPFLIKGAENELSKHFVGDSKLDIMVKTSGKLTLLDKLLPKLKADGHRVLIFSQFRIMLNIIEDYLALKDYSYERVDGSITGKKRQAAIDRYCKGNSTMGYAKENQLFCMLLSTRAGGVGINLTAADVVIIFDSDWNPQNDLQAQARAHRIGQTKEVKVYRLLTKKTYETVMFRAASIKLGLDYAIMHNIKGNTATDTTALTESSNAKKRGGKNKKEQCEAVAGITTERAEHASNLSKRELENLLKHGAYDIFREEKDGSGENESNRFCEETIDQILSHSSVIVHKENEKSVVTNNSFSKASFVQNDANNTAVAIDDPEFWSKVVGLSEGDQAIYDGTTKRRCREAISSYKEPGMKFALVNPASDSDNSDREDAQERKKSKRDRENEIVPAEYNAANLNTLLTSLVSRGYGNWSAIKKDTKLKWSLTDIATGCRYCLLQLLYWSCLSQNPFNPAVAVAGKKKAAAISAASSTTVTDGVASVDTTGDNNEVIAEGAAAETDNTENVVTASPAKPTSATSAVEVNNITLGFEDLVYLESHLKKYKACRVALAAFAAEITGSASSGVSTVDGAENGAENVGTAAAVLLPLEDSILAQADLMFTQLLADAAVTAASSALSAAESKVDEMLVEGAESGSTTADQDNTAELMDTSVGDISVDMTSDAGDISAADISFSAEDSAVTVPKPVLPTYMAVFDNETGYEPLTNKSYVRVKPTAETPLTPAEQFSALYRLVATLKSLPVPGEFSAYEQEKVVKVRAAARNKLLQVEDLFEHHLAAQYIQSECPEPVTKAATLKSAPVDTNVPSESVESSATAEDSNVVKMDTVTDDAADTTTTIAAASATTAPVTLSTEKTLVLLNAITSSEYYLDAKNNMVITPSSLLEPVDPATIYGAEVLQLAETAPETAPETASAASSSSVWSAEMDKILVNAVAKIGNPEGKRKLAQVEQYFHSHGHFLDCTANTMNNNSSRNRGGNKENNDEGVGEGNNGERETTGAVATPVATSTPTVPAVENEYLNAKFLTKRVKDLAAALRAHNNIVVPGPVVVVEKEPKKEKDNSAKRIANEKRFVSAVLKAVQRVGYPHSMYDHLRTYIASKSDATASSGDSSSTDVVDLCASPVKKTTTAAVASETTSASEDSAASTVSTPVATDGTQYLLTWDQLTAECAAQSNPAHLLFIESGVEKVKEIVAELLETYHRPEMYNTEATATIQTGLLTGIAFKTVESTLEKGSATVHMLRQILSFHSDAELAPFITKGVKGCGANTPQSKRDSSMPVWWTATHDITLLKLTLEHGIVNYKKIVTCNEVQPPQDFVMPPKIGKDPWVTVLTTRSAEKRVNALLAAIPLPSAVNTVIPPDSPSSKVRVAPVAEKKAGSSIMNKFGGAAADPFKTRVFGVKPAWATALTTAKETSATATSNTGSAAASTANSTAASPVTIAAENTNNIGSQASSPMVVDEVVVVVPAPAVSQEQHQSDKEISQLTQTQSQSVTSSEALTQSQLTPTQCTQSQLTQSSSVVRCSTPLSTADTADSDFFRTSPMTVYCDTNDNTNGSLFPLLNSNNNNKGADGLVNLSEAVKQVKQTAGLSAPRAVSGVAMSLDTTPVPTTVSTVLPHSVSVDVLATSSDNASPSAGSAKRAIDTIGSDFEKETGDLSSGGSATKKLKLDVTSSPAVSKPPAQVSAAVTPSEKNVVVDMTDDDVVETITPGTAAATAAPSSSGKGSASKAAKSSATTTPAKTKAAGAAAGAGSSGKKKKADTPPVVPPKPTAGIMSFFKKV